MSMIRVMGLLLLAVVASGELGAQGRGDPEVETLLQRVAQHYAGRPNLEVTAYTRQLRVEEVQDAESPTATYRVASAEYGRLVLTRRLPTHWRIVSQWERVSRGEAQPSRTFVFGMSGEGDSSMLLLNASTQATARIAIPAGMFQQEVQERVGHESRQSALFRLLFLGADPGRSNWAVFHGAAAELKVEGTEEVEGVQLTRIASAWPPSTITRLWIDPKSLTLVRSLETPGDQSVRMRMSLEVKETIYRHDFGRGAADADFDLEAGWALARPNIASDAGFSPSTELFAAITSGGTIKPDAPVANDPNKPKTPRRPPAGAPTQPPASGQGSTVQAPAATPPLAPEPPKVEEQRLTPEQMGAIVLIEGEVGAGTGFVTEIRGLPFVVTNLHVVGGNEKPRITTLNGAKVEVGPIHGAVGRDLAILRIEGAAPAARLKLAADPLLTAKIGDKVVVVGNRRGGGVATQVSGALQGLGPEKIEVDAAFQPGNSGSPIVHLASGEVIGLAAYSQTRELDLLDGPAAAARTEHKRDEPKIEQRWFGFRIDGVGSWEAIDQARWRAQAARVDAFRADSEAIYHAMTARFDQARHNEAVGRVIARFEERFSRSGPRQVQTAQEVGEFFRSLRALAENGKRELRDGQFYDYFRSSLYWETNISEQLRTREEIARYLDRASDNSTAFLSRLRN